MLHGSLHIMRDAFEGKDKTKGDIPYVSQRAVPVRSEIGDVRTNRGHLQRVGFRLGE